MKYKIKTSYRVQIASLAVLLFILFNINIASKTPKSEVNKLTLGDKSLNFLVLSDWGRDGINDTNKKSPGQIKVAKQLGETAKEIDASFIVTCGDNFHSKGVSSLDDPLWKVNFENVYTAPSLNIPWYITLGNHDNEGNVQAELDYAKTSDRWIQPARYFSFEKNIDSISKAIFVILDSSPIIEEYKNEKKDGHHIKGQNTDLQVKWCDSVLKTTDAKWKFVIFHHPAYSSSGTHGSTQEIQKIFVPLFDKYNVDVCFSGHDHDLQHSKPKGSNIDYFVVGGGSEYRQTDSSNFTVRRIGSLGFGVGSLKTNEFKFSFVNEKGKQLYEYEIKK